MRAHRFGTDFDYTFDKTGKQIIERRKSMFRKLILLTLALAFTGLLVGCSDKTNEPDDLSSLESEFGGYLPTDESPGFGDPVLVSEIIEDEEFDDPVLVEPETEEIINSATSIYAMRIVWGRLEYDSLVQTVTDWSGSLNVSWGGMVLRRVIKFEPFQDWIIPRTDRKKIEWVSKTTVHHDGIFVNIYQPPSTTDDIKTVSFITGPLEITYDVNDLARLDTIICLDDGNAVAIHAHKLHFNACPRGFLAGLWGRDANGNRIFFGKWMNHNAAIMGHLKGRWGSDPNGNPAPVFYGKYIDTEGNFKGLLKGVYGPVPSVTSANVIGRVGFFRGYFYDANRNILGVLKGHYRNRVTGSGMGYFQGRWRTFCNMLERVDDGMDEI